ncbi:hypothetical protein [Oenococcus oeni]|uniref:Uncharacterized protein n=1 Tax=Oenococcus oeni AWRIB429 TaxID=655225 RepID=D3L6W2_OENOE|nr:hypothetical protein [Oenococcus oeni]EFD89444.1 hypothetical protein AWRIB429_0092 [Oenococcus oeni AWRIB429]EJN91619.1 hypothetical protein AWRIB304_1820 [Oenococcus oeni AWRIB304]EJO02938.1 hypothetical protein AWRIB318_113 [Oenococcus oeni AWRIB318]EJO09054.1 hypothetical protein AWRIB568_1863 [Oenococcus oeni AWRIB568]EJO11516.1 hypothetical protein AWRIB576_413 [Oenococcus oeni AWRIB576]
MVKNKVNQIEIIHTAGDYHLHEQKVNDYLKYSSGHVVASFVGTPNAAHHHEPGHFYTVIEYELEVSADGK